MAPLLALYLAHWLTDFRRQQAKLPKLIARLRELGCPTDAKEVDALMPVPAEQNAAQEYELVFSEIERLKSSDPTAYDRVSQNVLETKASDESLLIPFEPLLALHRGAVDKPLLRINALHGSVIDGDTTGPNLRFIAKLLTRKILIAAEKGDHQTVRSQMGDFRRLADHSLYQPTQLSWLIHVAINTMYLSTFKEIAKRDASRRDLLDWAEEAIRVMPPIPSLMPHIKGEVAYSIAYHAQSQRKSLVELGFVSFSTLFGYFNTRLAWDAFLSNYLQGTLHQIENWPIDESDWQAIAKLTRPTWMEGKWWIAPSLGLPVIRVGGKRLGSGNAIGSYLTRLHMARLGLAIYRFFEEHARFPATLSDVPLSAPDSPPATIEYRLMGDSFILRSGRIKY